MKNEPKQPQTEGLAAVGSSDLVGRKWQCIINGKRHTNSKRYGATYTGTVEAIAPENTIYDLMRELADYLETNNAEMGHPDSFQMILLPPNH